MHGYGKCCKEMCSFANEIQSNSSIYLFRRTNLKPKKYQKNEMHWGISARKVKSFYQRGSLRDCSGVLLINFFGKGESLIGQYYASLSTCDGKTYYARQDEFITNSLMTCCTRPQVIISDIKLTSIETVCQRIVSDYTALRTAIHVFNAYSKMETAVKFYFHR